MKKASDNNFENSSFRLNVPEGTTPNNMENFSGFFGNAQLSTRAPNNYFPVFEGQHKFSNLVFEEDFSPKNAHYEAQANECKFEFGPSLYKDSGAFQEDLYNFQFEYDLSIEPRSQEYILEQGFDTISHHLFTIDCQNEFKSMRKPKMDNKKVIGEAIEEEKKIDLKVPHPQFVQKLVSIDHERNEDTISPNSQLSYDSERLERLIKCLTKSKGVNKAMIGNDIVGRTIELGQQAVAEQLKIPYRRYKSILNKVGIKTSAGRKVKNLQLETKLVEWAMKVKESHQLLTRKMIREKAAKIIKELVQSGDTQLKKIRLSKGWLDKFVKRHPNVSAYITSQKGKKGQ